MKTTDLKDKGFTLCSTGPGGEAWVRIKKKGTWIVGDCVLVTPGLALRISAAACLGLATLDAIAMASDIVQVAPAKVGGFGKNFKRRIHRAATKIAKMKVLNKLRHTYMKVIQGPIGDLGIAAGARALSAFGVPAAATRLALTQRRNAQADRLAHGGWAGTIATATGKGGLRAVAEEALERNKRAAIDALPSALPGGGLASIAKGALAKGALGKVTTGYDPASARATYLMGFDA